MSDLPTPDVKDLLDRVEADFGSQGVIIQRGRDIQNRFDLRRPCGIPRLDIKTGGGLPAGGLSQVDGPDGVGKNYLVNRYFATGQHLYGDDFRAFMVCLEYPFDKKFAIKCGFKVPMSEYEIDVEQRAREKEGLEPYTKEEIEDMITAPGEFVVLRAPEAEAVLGATVKLIESNSFQIGAIDSWDSMLTAAEADAELDEDARIARPATVQTQWMKKVQGALQPRQRCRECFAFPLEPKKHAHGVTYSCKCGWKSGKKTGNPILEEKETTIIGIRQVRANMKGGLYSRAWKVGGSHALKHGKLIDISLRQGEYIKEKSNVKIGKEVHWEITKGKAGVHEGGAGTYKFYFNPPEVDIIADLMSVCKDLGVVRVRGRTTIHIRHDGQETKYQSGDALLRAVEEDAELADCLWNDALIASGLSHVRHR